MISLDNGDKIRGDASVATVVDYILSGTDANAIKQLADGQLPVSIGDLYTADSVDAVTSIILVNTDSVARTVNLYLTPSGGSARRLIPKNMTLGIGHSLYTDGRNITVLDASGQVLSTWAVDDTPVDGETDKPISSNWAFDHEGAADPHTGYRLESADHSHQTAGAQAGKIDHGAALNGLGDDDHAQYIRHSLAAAANDFLVASGSGTYVKKTLAETGAILEADLDHGSIQGLGDDDHTQYVLKTLLDAHSMVMAVSDNTPVVLAVAASRFVGRKASGNIAAMTGAEAIALLTGANMDVGAYNVRGATLTADGLTSGRVVFAGASGLLSGVAAFTFSVDTLTVTKIGAFEAVGDISLGANKLKTTNLIFKELSSSWWWLRNAADNGEVGIVGSVAQFQTFIASQNNAELTTRNANGDRLIIKARDTDIALVEVARLQGADDPYFSMGGSQEQKFTNAGLVGFFGAAPVAQQVGVVVSAAGIHAALVNLGLITA